MLVIAYFVFVILLGVGLLLGYRSWKKQSTSVTINNPVFVEFQNSYFRVYFLALTAEWLQGPYLYKLYSDYGFVDPYIGIIYVCGYVSSIIFGTNASMLADLWGRKKMCVLFTILYSLCCLTKISQNFAVLCAGRVLGGISTSLLFSSFDAWYIYEHTQSYQFPSEWLSVTFSKATFYNSIIAISAGFTANMLSEWLDYGSVAPFLAAIPFLIVAGITMQLTWSENYSKSTQSCKGCMEGLRAILTQPNILLIGSVQAMFESVMYIFVFLWTPVLEPAGPPLGIVFSSFMCCIWIGTALFDEMDKKGYSLTHIVIFVVYGVMVTNFGAALASATHPRSSFMLFLATEVMCGIYFPAMGKLRAKILPPKLNSAIMNWFRVPLNLIASVVLLGLHDSHSSHGITQMFMLCAGLLFCGGISSVLLHMRVKNTQINDDEEEGQTNF